MSSLLSRLFACIALTAVLLFMAISCTPSEGDRYPPPESRVDGFNGTIFVLDDEHAQVWQRIWGLEANVTLYIGGSKWNFIDAEGNPGNVEVEERFWGGIYQYHLKFTSNGSLGTDSGLRENRTGKGNTNTSAENEPTQETPSSPQNGSGYLHFEIPTQTQRFIMPMDVEGPVELQLPPGYTTGERVLGIPRPPPDRILQVGNRTALRWNSTSDIRPDVGYYREGAPESLAKALAMLAILAVILGVYYYMSLRRLRSIREEDRKV